MTRIATGTAATFQFNAAVLKLYTHSVNVFVVNKILMERDLSGATTSERESLQEAASCFPKKPSSRENAFLAADARKRCTHPAAEDSYVKSFGPPVHAHPLLNMCSLVTPARHNTSYM